MGDGPMVRRNYQALDHGYLATPGSDMSGEFSMGSTMRSPRPVSWHPSSHLVQTQMAPQPYNYPTYNEMELFPNFQQFPPTPAAYSGYTSPSSIFSPLSLPYSGFEAPPYFPADGWSAAPPMAPNSISPGECQALPEQLAAALPQPSQMAGPDASDEWGSFVKHGFNRCTAPPTPESYHATEQLEPKVPTEDSIQYQRLEDDESEGEILIGMGLYDPPEKEVTDPTLESYRTSVAHLLGSAYAYPEPTGKGLKLEDAWEPPEIDDEEDDEDSDAKGEEQDDES